MSVRNIAFALTASALVFAGVEARAVTIVLGGGLAEECYATAEIGDVFKGFDICSRALRNPELKVRDKAATYINRSVIRLRVRDYKGAIDDCDQSIQRYPNLGESYVNRGAALLNLDRPQEALQSLNKAITLGLDKVHLAYYNRGLTRERLNDAKGAFADYKKAVELNPEFGLAGEQLKRFSVDGAPAVKS